MDCKYTYLITELYYITYRHMCTICNIFILKFSDISMGFLKSNNYSASVCSLMRGLKSITRGRCKSENMVGYIRNVRATQVLSEFKLACL